MLPLDHLVYATPDLQGTVRSLAAATGVEPAEGGRHPGWGTRNYLLSLGTRSYLEIVGPDEEQEIPPGGRLFGIDGLAGPRLVRWCARASGLAALVGLARDQEGPDLGGVVAGARDLPGGGQLRWELTEPRCAPLDGLAPFLIDWLGSPHPARSAPSAGMLVALEATHPEPRRIRAGLQAIPVPGLDSLILHEGPEPGLRATLQTPRGEVVLT